MEAGFAVFSKIWSEREGCMIELYRCGTLKYCLLIWSFAVGKYWQRLRNLRKIYQYTNVRKHKAKLKLKVFYIFNKICIRLQKISTELLEMLKYAA